jgi:hypothetical protein
VRIFAHAVKQTFWSDAQRLLSKKKNKVCFKRKKGFPKKMLDVCTLFGALSLGALVFLFGYVVRRLYNRWRRRHVDTDRVDNKMDTPEHLDWEFDDTDRDLVRASLFAMGISLLFCYLKDRKCDGPECEYDQPSSRVLSQELFSQNYGLSATPMSIVASDLHPSDLTRVLTSDRTVQSPLNPSDLTSAIFLLTPGSTQDSPLLRPIDLSRQEKIRQLISSMSPNELWNAGVSN